MGAGAEKIESRAADAAGIERVFFDAVLHPNRSLSPRGFAAVMALAACVTTGLGIYFMMAGAWPIFGFLGLDLALLYGAFRLNYRAGRVEERILVTAAEVVVRRTGPGGQAGEISFNPHWLRIAMDDPPRHESRVRLASHGTVVTVGDFLAPEERLGLAKALEAAVTRAARAT